MVPYKAGSSRSEGGDRRGKTTRKGDTTAAVGLSQINLDRVIDNK